MGILNKIRIRTRLWVAATTTAAAVTYISISYAAPFTSTGWGFWPVLPFLPIILLVFFHGVNLIGKAVQRYEIEELACQEISDLLHSTPPQELRNKLLRPNPDGTVIDRLIAHATVAPDLDTASTIIQIPQGLEVEENQTFGRLQFLRNELVLLGLLSTVLSFAKALSQSTTGDLLPLIGELKRALTMTMSGVSTSIILGSFTSVIFTRQQAIKAKVNELIACLLPRIVPRYEKGTAQDPGSALILGKLQSYIDEVSQWRNNVFIEVQGLTAVFSEHRRLLSSLPQLVLPQGFTELNTELRSLTKTTDEMRQIVDQSVQILAKERSLDLNSVIQLLKEIRVDSEALKASQRIIYDKLIPIQQDGLQQIASITNDLSAISGEFSAVADGLTQNTKSQNNLVEAIQRLTESGKANHEHTEKMKEMVDRLYQSVAQPKTPQELVTLNKNVEYLANAIRDLQTFTAEKERQTTSEIVKVLTLLHSETTKASQYFMHLANTQQGLNMPYHQATANNYRDIQTASKTHNHDQASQKTQSKRKMRSRSAFSVVRDFFRL